MKDFKITAGKGFSFPLAFGWTLSVQFGPQNYSDNRGPMLGDRLGDYFVNELEAGERGADAVEIAVFDGKGDWRSVRTLERTRPEDGPHDPANEVDGWVRSTRVHEVIRQVRERVIAKIKAD